ncbi:MAG: flagellin [Methanomicrobiales archaeon HGW-Methanomicrobiales-5]|jgi:flagellin FlaB|nr:MAG: flagellin [Methanomicrobiales archaeon HGW-Methanomicrobiales-5]
MSSFKRNDEGFTGLEAAIVLIAFVVVAAVFSYVVLGAGFFTTQKAQETVYSGVAQSTSNIQMIGNVYGYGTENAAGSMDVIRIQWNIGLAPGAPSLDISKMIIVVSQPGKSKITQLIYTSGIASKTEFSVTNSSTDHDALPTLSGQGQGTVMINLGDDTLAKNDKINLEMRPSVGAALPFTRSSPATITATQVLY